MKKADIIKKLASYGVKNVKRKTVAELRNMLADARADGSKPGRNINEGPQPGDAIGRSRPHPS